MKSKMTMMYNRDGELKVQDTSDTFGKFNST